MDANCAFRIIALLLLCVWVVYTFISVRKYGNPSSVKEEAENGYKNTSESSAKRIIIIIAYMRTGSTLTAAFFQEYPGAFYGFEPIRSINSAFKHLGEKRQFLKLQYFNGQERSFTTSDKMNAIFDEINNWFTCKLDSLSTSTLTDKSHAMQTKIMKGFSQCIGGQWSNIFRHVLGVKYPNLIQLNDTEINSNKSVTIDVCLNITTDSCQKAPFLLFKFIRLQMKDVINLMQWYPELKVIHLVRDPRGIFYSRLNIVGILKQDNFEKSVQNHCSSIEDNLKYSKRILEKYKDRLKTLRYEDFADSPMETAREILEFAGVSFVKPLKTFIRTQTRARSDSNRWGVQRRNSSRTASKWRTLLDINLAKYAYKACEKSNRILGYLPLESVKEMRDEKIQSRTKTNIIQQLGLYDNFQ